MLSFSGARAAPGNAPRPPQMCAIKAGRYRKELGKRISEYRKRGRLKARDFELRITWSVKTKTKPTRAPMRLSNDEREELEKLTRHLGDEAAAESLMIHPSTLSRALARRTLRKSTTICIRARLRELNRGRRPA